MAITYHAALSERLSLYSRNKLKLGVFGPNMSSGIALTKVPERWSGSWEDNLRLAQLLDEAGIEFMLPVARWKGNQGATNPQEATLETITWACGLLAQTKRITVFGTVHVPLVHPVFAAKQFVTADHISRGRFGLNIVAGWNQDEFDMFGIEQREHDIRYEYSAEWLSVVRQLWEREDTFDFEGRFLRLKGLQAQPKPYGGTRPVMMNAGGSVTGRAFATKHCDFLFATIRTLEQSEAEIRDARERARELGREDFLGVFTTASVVCRPRQREAEEFFRYYAEEQADFDAVRHMLTVANGSTSFRPEVYERMRVRIAAGYGGHTIVGDPDRVAAEFVKLSEIGFTGVACGMVDYLAEYPFFIGEVLPRLERAGLRVPNPA
jgi:FMNH2-dependent dimethyl sulfone monooxygenase